jgi:hypothetical protein
MRKLANHEHTVQGSLSHDAILHRTVIDCGSRPPTPFPYSD